MLPGRQVMGVQRLVPIGIDRVEGAAEPLRKPPIKAPQSDAHKYTRGLGAIVGGAMPGAGRLAAEAALRGGAGYIKLASQDAGAGGNPALVEATGDLQPVLRDERSRAVLVGPGLGRDDEAHARLKAAISSGKSLVLDADALVLVTPDMLNRDTPVVATPHDGELAALCRSFSVIAEGRRARALALARTAKIVVVAKGPDTVIAAPDGRVILARPASSWLSVAGSGDVLAGIVLSRMAIGADPFAAASEAVWLHGEAARLCGPAFTPIELAHSVSAALGKCL